MDPGKLHTTNTHTPNTYCLLLFSLSNYISEFPFMDPPPPKKKLSPVVSLKKIAAFTGQPRNKPVTQRETLPGQTCVVRHSKQSKYHPYTHRFPSCLQRHISDNRKADMTRIRKGAAQSNPMTAWWTSQPQNINKGSMPTTLTAPPSQAEMHKSRAHTQQLCFIHELCISKSCDAFYLRVTGAGQLVLLFLAEKLHSGGDDHPQPLCQDPDPWENSHPLGVQVQCRGKCRV